MRRAGVYGRSCHLLQLILLLAKVNALKAALFLTNMARADIAEIQYSVLGDC